jgi:hypothetical protein
VINNGSVSNQSVVSGRPRTPTGYIHSGAGGYLGNLSGHGSTHGGHTIKASENIYTSNHNILKGSTSPKNNVGASSFTARTRTHTVQLDNKTIYRY